MARRRWLVESTPAEIRDEARALIQTFDGTDRSRAAWEAMYKAATSDTFYYSNEQLAALAEGLEAGMREGVR